ncbi:hypothetical protein [Sulfobacillus thermosulfidooxidans]|uniref:hypothetical protein n=1 Tax=Sulfobacillus thermosulfidooxidans TaxID=28034 RepID=UPI0006B4E15C|nr:hypothetical protein [Sulfobacillus thermosulfidooxidans]
MPRRTLYVREEDQVIWEKAEALSDQESMSALVTEALRRFILAKEQAAGTSPYQRIELEITEINRNGMPYDRKVAFTGRELVDDGPLVVYETAKHRLLFYHEELQRYWIYRTIEQAIKSDEFPPTLLAAVADALGQEWVEEWDI